MPMMVCEQARDFGSYGVKSFRMVSSAIRFQVFQDWETRSVSHIQCYFADGMICEIDDLEAIEQFKQEFGDVFTEVVPAARWGKATELDAFPDLDERG